MDAEAALEALYAEIPKMDCQKKCWQACGPIHMTVGEAQRIEAVAGFPLKNSMVLGADPKSIVTGYLCPLLQDHECSVYLLRPFICRIWGVAEGLDCGFGCKPERTLSVKEVQALLARVEAVAGPMSVGTASPKVLGMLRRLDDALNNLPRCACGKVAYAILGDEEWLCRDHAAPLIPLVSEVNIKVRP